jgi:polyvinyl alcohol dehydrogenase (cytochrome)
MDGYLSAYQIADGKIVWDFDAARDFPTANGIQAHGGSFSGADPTVADGMMFVNSGHANTGGAWPVTFCWRFP